MSVCGVCKKSASSESDVSCSGMCGYVFHSNCIKSELDGKKTRSGFKCAECKGASSQSSVKSTSSSSGSITKEFMLSVFDGFKKEVFAEFSTFKSEVNDLRSEVNDLSASVQFMSDKIDSSSKLMEKMTSQFIEIKKENEELKASNTALKVEVRDLRDRMRNLEQYSRINNIEINGLPTSKEENVKELVKDVGAAIGVQVQEADIAVAHRVPTFRKDRVHS